CCHAKIAASVLAADNEAGKEAHRIENNINLLLLLLLLLLSSLLSESPSSASVSPPLAPGTFISTLIRSGESCSENEGPDSYHHSAGKTASTSASVFSGSKISG